MNGNGDGNNAPHHFKDAAQIKEGALETADEKIKRLQTQNEFLAKRIDHLVSLEEGDKWVTELEKLRGAQVVAANQAHEHKREIRAFRAELYDLRADLEDILEDLKRRKPNLLTIKKEISAMLRALTLRIDFPHPRNAVVHTRHYRDEAMLGAAKQCAAEQSADAGSRRRTKEESYGQALGTEGGEKYRAARHGRKLAQSSGYSRRRDNRRKSAGRRKKSGQKNP